MLKHVWGTSNPDTSHYGTSFESRRCEACGIIQDRQKVHNGEWGKWFYLNSQPSKGRCDCHLIQVSKVLSE